MTCHLFAHSEEALVEAARKINLGDSWFHSAKSEMHLAYYELTPEKRRHAVELGATEVDKEGLAAVAKRHRASQSKTVLDLQKTYSLKVEALE
jgi:hypothetical protein